jgi:hypothetical protein
VDPLRVLPLLLTLLLSMTSMMLSSLPLLLLLSPAMILREKSTKRIEACLLPLLTLLLLLVLHLLDLLGTTLVLPLLHTTVTGTVMNWSSPHHHPGPTLHPTCSSCLLPSLPSPNVICTSYHLCKSPLTRDHLLPFLHTSTLPLLAKTRLTSTHQESYLLHHLPLAKEEPPSPLLEHITTPHVQNKNNTHFPPLFLLRTLLFHKGEKRQLVNTKDYRTQMLPLVTVHSFHTLRPPPARTLSIPSPCPAMRIHKASFLCIPH